MSSCKREGYMQAVLNLGLSKLILQILQLGLRLLIIGTIGNWPSAYTTVWVMYKLRLSCSMFGSVLSLKLQFRSCILK